MQRLLHLACTSAAIAMLTAVSGCQSQRHFEDPIDAVAALSSAAGADDKAEIRALFGPRTDELRSGDPDQDALDIASFRRSLDEAVEVERDDEDHATVLVGKDLWPFAVPLVRDAKGWRFDTDAGVEELENRRIGRNELRTIAACHTLIDAQAIYRDEDHDGDGMTEYATRLMSTEGTQDGLYWPSPGGVNPSPIGPVFAQAAVRTDDEGKRIPFNGYFYKLLTQQGPGAPGGSRSYVDAKGNLTGGWAVIAWPAEYDVTGVMSFLAGDSGVIYETDLGPDTDEIAADIDAYDPGTHGWTPEQP